MKTIELNDGYELTIEQSVSYIDLHVYDGQGNLVDYMCHTKRSGLDYVGLEAELKECENVFVYGTLKQNKGNNSYLKGLTPEHAVTVEEYTMTANGIPFVSKEPMTLITGELYKIDTIDRLRELDWLESHPSFYKREIIEVVTLNGVKKAWIYFCESKGDTLIPTGNFDDYRTFKKN
jgi:gamma-glutamylcyclotransferase (GGCT)/AIG2-like uncharacterized protein YtfP